MIQVSQLEEYRDLRIFMRAFGFRRVLLRSSKKIPLKRRACIFVQYSVHIPLPTHLQKDSSSLLKDRHCDKLNLSGREIRHVRCRKLQNEHVRARCFSVRSRFFQSPPIRLRGIRQYDNPIKHNFPRLRARRLLAGAFVQ